jgi:hypothetical protein
MRASIHSGFIRVGSQHASKPAATTFKPRVIRPDPDIIRQRQIYCQALRVLVDRLNDLITAAEPEEREFWQRILNQLEGGTND